MTNYSREKLWHAIKTLLREVPSCVAASVEPTISEQIEFLEIELQNAWNTKMLPFSERVELPDKRIAALESQLAEAQAELGASQKNEAAEVDAAMREVAEARAERDALRAEVERLRTWLELHAQHSARCKSAYDSKEPCTCGLNNLFADKEPTNDKS